MDLNYGNDFLSYSILVKVFVYKTPPIMQILKISLMA